MAAASRAIFERIPLVDRVLNVRVALIPLSPECDGLQGDRLRSKSIVVLNEMDLANSSQTKVGHTCLSLLNPERQLSEFFIPVDTQAVNDFCRKLQRNNYGARHHSLYPYPNSLVGHAITKGNMECYHVSRGFGYCSTSADYKMVKIISMRENVTTISLAEFFSLKVGQWREVAELDCMIVCKSATVTYQTMNRLVMHM